MKIQFGPLTPLILDTTVTEVMVNSPNKVFVEHKGVLVETSAHFSDERALWDLIQAILQFDQKDRSQGCTFDGVLPDGSRYNITLPPMTPRYPCLTIRKVQTRRMGLSELVQNHSLSDKAAYFLSLAVKAHLNIIVSGGTGSGKTSLLQALTYEIPNEERIVTIEDVPELKLQQKNWVQLLSVPQGPQRISARQCLINSLRMRPDRILIGECRNEETFEMLQAMNTGHEGSMTSLHANSPLECLTRLEHLLHMSELELPTRSLRSQIAQSIHLIVQIKRLRSGQRLVTEIMEITGMEGDVITRGTLFSLNKAGELVPAGYVPRCVKLFQSCGFNMPEGFFDPQQSLRKVS